MVHLNRIYTRGGDAGETTLGDLSRVPKTDPRIVAYGAVDELNAVVGVARCSGVSDKFNRLLEIIQNDLFDVGADLCVPHCDPPPDRPPLRILPAQVQQLERWIDEVNESLEPLNSFVLPGGSPASAALHHARTVCRRAEIEVLRLGSVETINQQTVVYLNRLSDLLFVLARASNDNGRGDVLWQPGASRQS
ncbi:MAG: cob(I)yrinic acid a,c-diamide adenosyltransferase [Planctomycetaceae bacterium]|nr:cob(I)yrinic acid a,c-diamide adenosyltransferase [Planctomycetaceae bacterium]